MGGKKGEVLCFKARSVPRSGSAQLGGALCAGEEAKGWEWDGRHDACAVACSIVCMMVPEFENYYGLESVLKETSGFGDLHLSASFTSFPVKITFNIILQM